MKLSDWAKKEGISYITAYRWWKKGILPVPAKQIETGTILLSPQIRNTENGVVLYARMSSSDQKDDLTRQLGRLVDYANNNKMKVVKSVSEVGSGLNGHRSKLIQLLHDPKVFTIVVEHRDRLVRFGFEYIEASLAASGRRVVVVDQSEMKDDLIQDMIDVLVSFCARLYGRRSAKNRAERAMKAMEDTDVN
jgi:predicted site-specific integrase-resolvase